MNMRIRNQLLSLLLALALLLSCVPEALAAGAEAATVQLTKTEGTVAISNSGGRSLSLIEKMRLYNGYHVETEEASYAWMNLDSTKLTKLDAVSEMELRKSGKKLELLLNEGNIFFNVTEPLDDDESLNIRTSTIVVGIRGTCGWVKIIDQWTVEVYVLEGTVTVAVTDPVTGQTKEELITGGEKAVCVVYSQDKTGDKCDILRDQFTEEDIDGFVLVELAPDAPLAEEIYEDSGIDLRDWPGDPDERLKQDQEEVRRKLEEIEKALEDQDEHISQDPVWTEPAVPAPTPADEEPAEDGGGYDPAPAPTTRTLMMPLTDDEVQAAVDEAASVYVQANPSGDPAVNTLLVDSGITVPAGKTLTLDPGIQTNVLAGQPLQVHGTLNHPGSINSNGNLTVTSSNTLRVGGDLSSGSTMYVSAAGRVIVEGTFTNSGTMLPIQGAVIQARQLVLTNPVTDWAVSDAPDSEGYYRLMYVGGGTPVVPGARYTVTFEGSGGVWPNGSSSVRNNVPSGTTLQAALADAGLPARDGYTLIGWNTESGGYGTAYAENTPITADVTIYALWTASGGGVTWRYDEPAAALYIEGSGRMESIENYNMTAVPWSAYRDRITAVHIAEGVTSIGSGAFSDCGSLASITIPDSVTSIGYNAFYNCRSLTSIMIPGDVTAIGSSTFAGCGSLADITLPEKLETIGDSAFMNCSSLTSIALPDGVTTIESNAFTNCSGLTSIEIPYGVAAIGYHVFASCASLTSISIPNSVTSIGDSAFWWCSGLTSITLPNSVTSIGGSAFEHCDNLTSITVPNSVTSIGASAFYNCLNLTAINYTGTETQWNAITKGANAIPDSASINYNSTPSPRAAQASPYADVSLDAWYADAVLYCREQDLMNGTDTTHFSPDGTLTRAMMVTVLHRLAGTPTAPAVSAFPDVEAGQWYTQAVAWASSRGIVLGYPDGNFGTSDPVTHEQVALIFQRYSSGDSVEIPGADEPSSPATRAEIAATLMSYAKGYGLSAISAMDVMCAPSGIAPMGDGSLLITDTYHKQLWRVQLGAGTVYAGGETVTGLYGEPLGGYNDAELLSSYFKEPWAAAPFLDGWAVSDTANNVVRLVRAGGAQTLNGRSTENLTVTALGVAFNRPTGLAADDDGNLYVSDTGSGAVRKITPEGKVTTAAKNLDQPMGLCWKNGVLYIAETGANRIVKLKNGKISTAAGSGEEGLVDGAAAEAAFSAPQGVTVGDDGSVYVSDTGNGAVRRVKNSQVTTLAVRDASQVRAGLTSPKGLLLQGNRLYICDSFARKVFVLRLG